MDKRIVGKIAISCLELLLPIYEPDLVIRKHTVIVYIGVYTQTTNVSIS